MDVALAGQGHKRDSLIVIPKELLESIVAHARREAPNEVCGWLAGEGHRVRRVYPVPNVAENAEVRFRMDSGMQLSTMREIRDSGLELTGTYHSHPRASPSPSVRDRGLAAYPGAVHLIVSLATPEPQVRCYRVVEEKFTAIELVLGSVVQNETSVRDSAREESRRRLVG